MGGRTPNCLSHFCNKIKSRSTSRSWNEINFCHLKKWNKMKDNQKLMSKKLKPTLLTNIKSKFCLCLSTRRRCCMFEGNLCTKTSKYQTFRVTMASRMPSLIRHAMIWTFSWWISKRSLVEPVHLSKLIRCLKKRMMPTGKVWHSLKRKRKGRAQINQNNKTTNSIFKTNSRKI